MTTRIKLRRDTAANWQLANPILAAGEPGLETDTGKVKYGDGVTAYADLAHAGSDQLINDKAITVTTGDDTKWVAITKRDDDWANQSYQGIRNASVIYDNAGNIVTAGYINQNNSNNFYVCKYSPAGVLLWKKVLVEVSQNFTVYIEGGMAIDSNNNIILSFNFDNPDCLLIKLDSDGESLWCRYYNDNDGVVVISSIAVNGDDDIFVTTWNPSPGSVMGIHKIARSTGDVLWTKQLNDAAAWEYGGSVAIDYLGNILLSGGSQGETSDLGVVVKLDADGALLWRKTLSMPDAAVDLSITYPSGIDVDSLGNVYITGSYKVQSPTTVTDNNSQSQRSMATFIIKLNTSGTVQWARRAGPGPCDYVGLSTTIGDDGDLYLAAATMTPTSSFNQGGGASTENDNWEKGYYEHNLVLARYKAGSGDVVWQKYFNNRHQQILEGSDGPNAGGSRSIDVSGDKLVICGGGQFAIEYGYGLDSNNWSTGWVAQLSTDGAVGFDLADFKFVNSRVPGRTITVAVTDNTTLNLQSGTFDSLGDENGIPMTDAPVSSVTIKSKTNTWTFDSEGDVRTPAEGNIVLDQTELGYINFVGYEDNQGDDIWFQSVVADAEGYTYAVGANRWTSRRTNVYKFDPQGKIVWIVETHSGSGSVWDISWTGGIYTIDQLTNPGINYRVGDTVVLPGYYFADGNSPQNNLVIEVTQVDSNNGGGNGYITGYEIQSGVAPAGSGSDTGFEDYNDDGECRPNSITIDPTTGNLNIIAEAYQYDNENSVLYLVLDAESGACLSNKELHSANKDFYGYDVQVSDTGVPAIVGQEYGLVNTVLAELSAVAGSPAGFIRIGKETIIVDGVGNDGRYPGNSSGSDWYVTGTGINGRAYVNDYNLYEDMAPTVTQGNNNATFTIISDGSGYASYPTVLVAGTGYTVVGHKLKVLGSALGGVDGVNDAILQILNVDAGGIVQVQVIDGVAGASSAGSYVGVSGTNYQVGSGARFSLYFDAITGAFQYANLSASGDNYTVNDTITFAGSMFPGSASPTNDVVFTVIAAGGSYTQGQRGPIYNWNQVGTPSISADYLSLKISNASGVDFTGAGAWQLLESRSGEAFVWTPTFQKALGGTANDWFNTTAWQGTNLYAAGASHNVDTDEDENLVVKFNAAGEVLWKKQITHSDWQSWSEIKSMIAHDDGVVVVGKANDWYWESYVEFIAKLDNAGNVMWVKSIYFNDTDPYASSIAVDSATGDFITATSGYNNDFDCDIIYLNKYDRDGNTLWKKRLSSSYNDYFNWDNGYRALNIKGDKFYFAGNTYWAINEQSNAYVACLPLDGTGTGEHGIWTYLDNEDANVQVRQMTNADAPTHVIEVQAVSNVAVNNARFYYMDFPVETFPLINQVVRDKTGGAIVFPDGTRQTTSAGVSQQIRVGYQYTVTLEDSGGHIFVDNHDTNNDYWIYIPYWEFVKLPVGFKFTVINRNNTNVYVQVNGGPGPSGSIYGINGGGNYDSYYIWYINGNSNGANWIDFMKVKEGQRTETNSYGDQWAIRGPIGSNQFGTW